MQTGPTNPDGQPLQQPPYQPQPYQPSMYQPYPPQYQPQPPKKKRRTWLWIALAVIIVIGIISAISNQSNGGGTPSTTSATSSTANSNTGASTGKWTVIQHLKSSGNKKTVTFTVGDNWKIQWTCNPSSFADIGQYNLAVDVMNSDNTPADMGAINEICKKGNTSGETQEHQGGDVYLDITSEADWTITVQEFK